MNLPPFIDRKAFVHEKLKSGLQTMFRSLLNQIMTAEICVGDLDLSELGLDTEDKEAYRS